MRMELWALSVVLIAGNSLSAQVTVQQPVVRSTSVATSVSVPDRGRTLLGSVNSAESFRNSYGPWRNGTTRGSGLSGGSMSVSVTIIDLQAMDEALLASAPETQPARREPRQTGTRTLPPQSVATLPPAEKAAQFERLARQAEAAGKPSVARLHWQMAARYGSSVAREQLAATTRPRE